MWYWVILSLLFVSVCLSVGDISTLKMLNGIWLKFYTATQVFPGDCVLHFDGDCCSGPASGTREPKMCHEGDIITPALTHLYWIIFIRFLSASFTKEALIEIGCVVGRWLVVTCVHCGQTVHPRPIVTMEH